MYRPTMSERACRHVRIHGRVQGVGYRAWTVDAARRHGLKGWVRNLRDGTVEALICGDSAAVDAMLADMESGPPVANVKSVEARESDRAAPAGFEQRPTAEPPGA